MIKIFAILKDYFMFRLDHVDPQKKAPVMELFLLNDS